jgi:hypothetical protein
MVQRIPTEYRRNFNRNLTLLKGLDQNLYKKVIRSRPEKFIEFTKKNSLTLKKGGIYVESRYDPEGEAKVYKRSDLGALPIYIGSGLGYHINELQKEEDEVAVIIEREVDIFRSSLYIIKPDILHHIIPLVGLDTSSLEVKIGQLQLQKSVVFEHPRSVQLHRIYYSKAKALLTSKLKEWFASAATERASMRLWIKNVLRNLMHRKVNVFGLKPLHARFRGPVILVSSGPFLKEIITDLTRWSRNLPVIALLPSLRYLLDYGVIPDFVVSTDAGFWNRYRLVRGCTIPLITTCTVDSVLLRNWAGETYLFSHGLPVENQFRILRERSIIIPMQGTASIVMILLARQLGFTKLFLAGYDFAFSGLMDHAYGAGFDDLLYFSSTAFRNWQTHVLERLKRDRIVAVHDHFGDEITSTHKLVLYRNWFERELELGDLIRLNNGARIAGLSFLQRDMIEQYGGDVRDEFKEIKSELRLAEMQIKGSTELLKKIRERVTNMREDSQLDVYEGFFGPAFEKEGVITVSSEIDFLVHELDKVCSLAEKG